MGLGGRLAVAFAVLAAVTAMVVGLAAYVTTERQVTEEIDHFLRQRANELTSGERERPPDRDGNGQRDEIDLARAVDADSEVQVLAKSGEVVSNSGVELPVDARDEQIADRRQPGNIRSVTIDGVDYRMITVHVDGGGAVQVARELDETNSLLDDLRGTLLLIAFGLAALAALVGWFLARRTTRPLRSLTRAVDEVAETRDFSATVDVGGSDEIGRLGAGFNRLLEALNVSRQQQRRLVQDAAHELRTPLTSIKANVDFLTVADGAPAEERREALVGVRRELNELSGVIDEIIELATEERSSPDFEELDLGGVVVEACDRFRSRSSRAVLVDTSPSIVLGDADALHRAITNLLSNAEKYSPPSTPIRVTSSAGMVSVSDSGAGIPPEERDLVFERFYRAEGSRSAPGSGLGLAIVRSVVDAHGGSVDVTDSPDGGAMFRLVFPVVQS
jgi:two-component system sensor histidine kinase MprB